jgi:sugar lactone lactonase YvrE
MNEINAGRPVMIQVSGHSMVGVGYDDDTQTMYLHDTWDYQVHSMTWGGEYAGMQHVAMSVFELEPLDINCEAINTFPYSEDFSDLVKPSCWTVVDNIASGQVWQFDNPGSRTINTPTGFNGFAIVDSAHMGGLGL